MSARVFAVGALLLAACSTHGAEPRDEQLDMMVAEVQARPVGLHIVRDSLDARAARLPACAITAAPPDWREVRLATASATARLPAEVMTERMGPDSNRFEGWYGGGAQVIAIAERDSAIVEAVAGQSGRCALPIAGHSAPVQFTAHRARAGSTADSVYGAEIAVVLPSGELLSLQIGAEGRARFASLLPVLASLTPVAPR